MPKLIVSIDGIVVREVQLIKDRTTLGRRPYNDVVIDNLAVSGEHAVINMSGSEVVLEDLNSTNGTYINGKAVKRQVLQNDDTIEVGKYRVKYVADTATQAPQNFDRTMVIKAGAIGALAAGGGSAGRIKVMSGPAAGREVPLVKAATTVGKPGVAVASINKLPDGFALVHVEGNTRAQVNGQTIGDEPQRLNGGDIIDLAGTQMQFLQG